MLSSKIINNYNGLAQKYANVTVKDFGKYKKLEYKKNKLKLDIDCLNNCKQLNVYPKFLIFKLPNVSNTGASSFRKKLFRSAINKRNKELQHLFKKLSISRNFLSKQLSTTDFYILNPKTAGGVNLTSFFGFSKNVSSKGRAKAWFFGTFNVIISPILPEIFIQILQIL